MVLWASVSALSIVLLPVDDRAPIVVAATGAVIALAAGKGPLPRRLALALALVPAALVAFSSPWIWAAGGLLLAIAVSGRAGAPPARPSDLQRHLSRCRRRSERAHVLVLRWSARDETDPAEALAAFRMTDSVTVLRRAGDWELHAVLDDHELVRVGVERRIREVILVEPRFGWAVFPDDGVTLDDLVDQADRDAPAKIFPYRWEQRTDEAYARA